MTICFKEDCSITSGREPGNWFVEMNSDLPFSAFECDGRKISLQSSGNKYIPLTHPLASGEISFRLGLDIEAAGRADFQVCFRYDQVTRSGECVRLTRNLATTGSDAAYRIEYGTNRDNVFQAESSCEVGLCDSDFKEPVPVRISFQDKRVSVTAAHTVANFTSVDNSASGCIALCRGTMYCLADVYDFEIRSTLPQPEPLSVTEFEISYPESVVIQPVTCRMKLKIFEDFCEADVEIGGGVRTTPPGEGRYHVMRTDVIDRPYLKIISGDRTEKLSLYRDRIIWVHDEIAPAYFYQTLHKRVAWPYRTTVRFSKPQGDYMFAIGAEEFYNTVRKQHALSPAETLFDSNGEVLDSGAGITALPARISFISQPEKEIINRIPKDDPQYNKALSFARNNHYFLGGEAPDFSVEILSLYNLPETVEIVLENAYFEKIRTIRAERTLEVLSMGVLPAFRAVYKCLLSDLHEPGVYHLRCRSTDPSLGALEDYCAFEIMSREPDAPPAPLISGLPFLYAARTETRGLETDAFDPWQGCSVDDGHYIACTVFMPAWGRENRIAPTLRAYQREWFLWLDTRNCEKPSLADNRDLIREADYVYLAEIGAFIALWTSRYSGSLLETLLRFAESSGDSGFDLDELKRRIAEEEPVDFKNFSRLAEHHWAAWLEVYGAYFKSLQDEAFRSCRELNPGILFSAYGPGAIYASHYKGQEFTSYYPLTEPEKVGFWQYEDYPVACRYGIERGTYFLAASQMKMPDTRIYPEIYVGGGLDGCPDGAVNYAHPPYGVRESTAPGMIARRVLDYALAAVWFNDEGFQYWRNAGFQACAFDRGQYEALIKAWRTIREWQPLRPLRGTAFVYSEESWLADSGQTIIQSYNNDSIVDVRKTVAECVPMAYEEARRHGLAAGFLVEMSHVGNLSPEQVDTLVLPPLEGVSQEYKAAIRSLHEQGVNLLAFENVPGLEDLFGVSDTGEYRQAVNIRTTAAFPAKLEEYCSEAKCVGKYRVVDATVLVEAEIPVLTIKTNGKAHAALFNVPPTLINADRHVRLGYGRESISPIVRAAMGEVLGRFSRNPVCISEGRLIAYEAVGGETVLIVTNPDDSAEISPFVTLRQSSPAFGLSECSVPHVIISDDEEHLRLRLRLKAEEAAVLVLKPCTSE